VKELETIKNKIKELEDKKQTLSKELAELSQAIEDSFEDLLLGKVDEATIDAAKEKYEALSEKIKKTDEYLQRAKVVRKKLAVEKVIPFAKENRKKKLEEIQQRYDNQAEAVRKARNAFLQELAKLGKIKNEVGGINAEMNSILVDLGEKTETYGATIQEKPVISGGWTDVADCLGIEELTQKQVYSGNIPAWAEGDSK